MALCSFLGLAALRLRVLGIAALAIAVFYALDFARSSAFIAPNKNWTGLQTAPLRKVGHEPSFPWFAPFLAYMAVSKLASRLGLWTRLSTPAPSRTAHLAGLPGGHSLLIHLIHRPVLIGIVWTATLILV